MHCCGSCSAGWASRGRAVVPLQLHLACWRLFPLRRGGTLSDIDLDQLFDGAKSLSEGAITIPGYNVDGWQVRIFSESGFFDPGKRIRDYTEEEMQTFLYATYEGCPEGLSAEGQGKPAAAPSGVRRARCRLQPALNAVGLDSTRLRWPPGSARSTSQTRPRCRSAISPTGYVASTNR
jgi:hypothetical protein